MSAPRGPDFLIIGAQRAGTTWLHQVLAQHPALWLTPVKELHYFDKPWRTRTWLDPRERQRVRLIPRDRWHLRYLLGRRNDKWYKSLFHEAQCRGLLAGESTPSYAVLDDDMLRAVHQMNGDVKLIFVMRDPVDRAWSHVTNRYRKGRADDLSVERALDLARSRKVSCRSSYLDTIKRVEAIFPPQQLFPGFFDDLRDRPEQFTGEVLSFLGVEPTAGWMAEIPNPVNATGRSKSMPLEFARSMAEFHLPAVRELSQLFEGPPQKWQARYDALINDSIHAR